MNTLTWMIGIAIITFSAFSLWLQWVNAPLNEMMSIPRPSMESQVQYIKSKYMYRLVRMVTTDQPDVFSPWAIAESNRRTLVLATVWLAIVIIWTLLLYRFTPAA